MAQQRPTTHRLASFSDGVFAVIITIMVLELKPPQLPTFAGLLPLWPTALSYIVSYYFIAIVWLNHHHLLRFFPHSSPRLIWINFVHLFMVSLVPTLGTFILAMLVALKSPLLGFGLVCCALLFYLRPEPPWTVQSTAQVVREEMLP